MMPGVLAVCGELGGLPLDLAVRSPSRTVCVEICDHALRRSAVDLTGYRSASCRGGLRSV